MSLQEVALVVVLVELAEQSTKLNSLIAVLDVLEEHVANVLLEDVECKHQYEEVANFFFEEHPEIMLIA